MDIDEYLWRNKLTTTKAAEKLDISSQTLRQCKKKVRSPSLLNAMKMLVFFDGIVPAHELLGKEDLEKYREWLSNNI